MADIRVSTVHPVSGLQALVEDDGHSVWLYLRDQNATGIQADCWLYNHRPFERAELSKWPRDQPPPAPSDLVGPEAPLLQEDLRACGWWTLDQNKLRSSTADFWVFVLLGFGRLTTDFVLVPPRELWRRLRSIHGANRTIQSYLWVTERDHCWETRGLNRKDQLRIANGTYRGRSRDFSKWLNTWGPVGRLNA